MAKKTEAELEREKRFGLDEIGNQVEIAGERVNFKDEAFANDILEIEVHATGDEGALDVITPSVNGVNQPIVRGKRIPVKRKYVEALARSRNTKYSQQLRDTRDPGSLEMVERTVLAYPFVVHSDPAGDRGRAWLQGILAT
ncbi:MAG: hypothetical protein ABIK07_14260 [Planctomycetota bacterium]